jgi:Raf kinase inhibitor-like YbhB/YbcL family protein
MFVNLLTILPASGDAKGASSMTLSLTSSAFAEGGEIPMRYTCEGEDVSPPRAWSEPSSGIRNLALIVDDPDAPDPKAPRRTWVHWVLYNPPPTASQLPEAGAPNTLPTTREGLNDWKRMGYGGP